MVVDSVQLAHRPAGSRGRARTPFRAFGATPLRSDHRLTRGVKKPMLWAPRTGRFGKDGGAVSGRLSTLSLQFLPTSKVEAASAEWALAREGGTTKLVIAP